MQDRRNGAVSIQEDDIEPDLIDEIQTILPRPAGRRTIFSATIELEFVQNVNMPEGKAVTNYCGTHVKAFAVEAAGI